MDDFVTDSDCPVKAYERYAAPAYGYLLETAPWWERWMLRVGARARKRRTVKYMRKTIKGWERKAAEQDLDALGEIVGKEA